MTPKLIEGVCDRATMGPEAGCHHWVDRGCLLDHNPAECPHYDPEEFLDDALDEAIDRVLDEIHAAVKKYGPHSALYETDPANGSLIVLSEAGEVATTITKSEGEMRRYHELKQLAGTCIAQMARIDVGFGGVENE